jgi:hypothetical protein
VIADGGGLASAMLHPVDGGEQIAHIWAVRKPEKLRSWPAA